MNITAFPYDLFLLIVAHLSPSDLVLARRVSKAFHLAFTDSQLCLHLLQQHYPRVREVRDVANEQGEDWSRVFSRVAARYHYLKLGKPRSVEKFALGKSFVVPKWARYYPVSTWHQLLKFEEKAAPFHYPDPLWTYSDGVLVFPSIDAQKYMLYDLSNGSLGEFDFQPESKIVRRIRLKDNVLVVEWCEQEAYHQLNESEMVYRHFATAYNLTQNVQNGKWEAVFRNEWKIHFLGMPLNSRDRFYSTHTSSHYALYLWQPNRSAWGEDDPIEALAVWDISSPSDYRPSEDPTGRGNYITDSDGPKVIRRFSFADMDFYRIRQRSTPTLRALELDENHVYFIEEDHRWLVGPEAAHNHARLHKVKSVGIPFAAGPHWMDECGANGDANISYCERDLNNRHPRFAPCWRHEASRPSAAEVRADKVMQEFPYLTTSEALDPKAGVKFSARHCFLLETISINVKSKIDMVGPGYEAALMDDMWPQLLNKGKICGDERWLIGENSSQEVVVLRFDEEPLKRR